MISGHGNLKTQISPKDYGRDVEIALYFENVDGSMGIFKLAGRPEIVKVNSGDAAPDDCGLVINERYAYQLYQGLHAYFETRGLKTKSEAIMEGELSATKEHLSDLRKLLKIK